MFIDNGSTDGTTNWLLNPPYANIWGHFYNRNAGVSHAWNEGLSKLFAEGADRVLVANNDTEMPSWFLSSLLGLNLPFVTGVSVDSWEDHPSAWPAPQESPDFSAFLIRRDAWEKIGPFDEKMKHYCGDIDYHLRARELGIPLMNAGVPFTHKRSSTIRNASPFDREVIERQANEDRAVFRAKWGDGHGV